MKKIKVSGNRIGTHELQDGECVAILSRSENALLETIAKVGFGHIDRVTVKDGLPVRLETVTQQVRLDG